MLRSQDKVSEEDTTGYGWLPSSRLPKLILEAFVAVPGTVKTGDPRRGGLQSEVEADPQRVCRPGVVDRTG